MIDLGDSVSNIVDPLVEGYINHYAKVDSSLKWLSTEQEHTIWLDVDTCLVALMDANGITEEGDHFFLELKTKNDRTKDKNSWKQDWRCSPQSLTYQVIADAVQPGTRKFLVRRAYKKLPVTSSNFDQEWFSFKDSEVTFWRSELLRIAQDIRNRRREGGDHWRLSYGHRCHKYGHNYPCVFYPTCSVQDWGALPPFTQPRTPSPITVSISRDNPDLVILSASRIDEWIGCEERYRKFYEQGIEEPSNEALDIGTGFHKLVGAYINLKINGAVEK